ncbi:MAG: hypothetical protein HYW05_01195 [Candidatus Diapherotrites archaeon]|nr:hypothetical protein [Candidatus Diapherotrites archaeon]
MTCWMMYLNYVRKLLKNKITNDEAVEILRDIEGQFGHDKVTIKAVIDAEKENLIKRLGKKEKKRKERETALASYA